MIFSSFVLAFIVLFVKAKCSLDPSLNACSASANETHPNHPRLSETGKEVERGLAKSLHPRPNAIIHTSREIPRLRYYTLENKARNAERSRNFWHEEKNRLDQKLERKNRSIHTKVGKKLSKIPGTMENKHKYARGKRDSYKNVLKDISKDSAVHRELGHLNNTDERNINAIKLEKSRQLGYTSEGSPRSPNANPNAVYIDDLRNNDSHTSP